MRAWSRVVWWSLWALVGVALGAGLMLYAGGHGGSPGLAALAAAGVAVALVLVVAPAAAYWRLTPAERDAQRRARERLKAKLAQTRARFKALQTDYRRLERELERTRAAVQKAQREASQARGRADRAAREARQCQQQAHLWQQRAQECEARAQALAAERQRLERAKSLLEAVHRLETWEEVLPTAALEAELPAEDLAQRLREAITRLHQERDTAFHLAREAEDNLQRSQAALASAVAQAEAYKAERDALQQRLQQEQAMRQRLLADLLDPHTDLVAVPGERWAAIQAYHDQQRAWEGLLTKLRRSDLRQGQTKALPNGGAFVYPRGRQPRRVLFFEQPITKRLLWVCRLWDTHEDDREYDTLTTQGATRKLCPDPAAFVYWTPSSEGPTAHA